MVFNRRVDTLVFIYKDSLEIYGGFAEFLLSVPRDFRGLHYLRGPSAPSTTSVGPQCPPLHPRILEGPQLCLQRFVEVHGGPWGSVEISGSRWRSVEFRVGPRGPRRSLELQKRFEFFFLNVYKLFFFREPPETSGGGAWVSTLLIWYDKRLSYF